MTDREKLIDIKNQIIEHLNEDEIEEPVEDEETEEPIEDEPVGEPVTDEDEEDDTELPPISDFKAEIIDTNLVKCTWIPNSDGKIDIEYYRPEKDKPWKHSVLKYVKTLINISDGFYNIGIGQPIEGSIFRAVKGEWVSESVEAVYPKPEPVVEPDPVEEDEPVVDEPETPIEPTPEPIEDGNVEIALVFHKSLNLDLWVNGKKIPKEKPFDYSIPNPAGDTLRVKLIRSDVLKTFEFDPEQVEINTFNIKVVNRDRERIDPDTNQLLEGTDLTKIDAHHTIPTSNWNFWGQPARENPLGIIYSMHGDTVHGVKYPDPLFYKGWRSDPANKPNDREFQDVWSENGKIVINLGV